MKTLLGYFWRGCLVLAPVGITVYIAWVVFTTIDKLLPVGIPGLGFVLTIAIITVVGFLTSNVIGKAVVQEGERLLRRVPLLKLLYTSIKDLINAFVGDKRRFDKPVAARLVPGSSARALGFVTRETLTHLDFRGHVAVYFPQSYNFAGNVLIMPRDQIEALERRERGHDDVHRVGWGERSRHRGARGELAAVDLGHENSDHRAPQGRKVSANYGS